MLTAWRETMTGKDETGDTDNVSEGLRGVVDLRLQERRFRDRRLEQRRYLEGGFQERRMQERRVMERRAV